MLEINNINLNCYKIDVLDKEENFDINRKLKTDFFYYMAPDIDKDFVYWLDRVAEKTEFPWCLGRATLTKLRRGMLHTFYFIAIQDNKRSQLNDLHN